MKTIVFFNNKGGVGKTTLACNVAAELSRAKLRVLLVDCDPQCNSTQLILGEERSQALYDKTGPNSSTIMKVVEHIRDGDSAISEDVKPLSRHDNRFEIDVLPGDPRLSIIEDKLSIGWGEVKAGEVSGFRKANWFYFLVKHFQNDYDVAIVDVGPSLGSLNRSVLVGSDYFLTPMGSDIFSIIGVRNIGEWLGDWLETYKSGASKLQPDRVQHYGIPLTPNIGRGFIGYTVQQYITKSKEGVRIPTRAHERILRRVSPEITTHLKPFSARDARSFKLGDVPNMYSLVPLAQSVGAPITRLVASDGLVGSQFSQVANYRKIIQRVARSISRRVLGPA